jgi:hypothetical protein
MGHSIGLDDHYFKPGEKEKTETWLKNFFKEINHMLCVPEPLPDSELNDIWKSAIDFVGRIREAKKENAREKQGNGIH